MDYLKSANNMLVLGLFIGIAFTGLVGCKSNSTSKNDATVNDSSQQKDAITQLDTVSQTDMAIDGNVDGNIQEDGSHADVSEDVDPLCATINGDATFTAKVKITTDDECEVFVNGVNVGKTTNWGSPVTIDLSFFLHPAKKNVIAVRAANKWSQNGNDRGLIGEVIAEIDGESTSIVVTDSSWKVSGEEKANWTEMTFDDSNWIAATEIANHGDSPWGALFGTSSAKWIWGAAVPVSTGDKPNEETIYARKTFYFSIDGTSTSGVPACPPPK